jgi:OOP family OmpA-OmpF porin
MKKILYGLFTFIGLSILLHAGGDIFPPVSLENEEAFVPAEPYVEPVKVIPSKATPPPVVLKEINPSGLYVALGLTAAMYDPNCACPSPKGDSDKTAGFIGRLGYDFNEYIGLEGRALKSNWKSNGGKIKHAGLFLKPMYPASEDMNIYGLAGYAKTTTQGKKRRVDVETFSWGIGLEYDLAKDIPKDGKYDRNFDGYGDQERGWGLFADYARLVQKSESPDLDTVNFGITYDF